LFACSSYRCALLRTSCCAYLILCRYAPSYQVLAPRCARIGCMFIATLFALLMLRSLATLYSLRSHINRCAHNCSLRSYLRFAPTPFIRSAHSLRAALARSLRSLFGCLSYYRSAPILNRSHCMFALSLRSTRSAHISSLRSEYIATLVSSLRSYLTLAALKLRSCLSLFIARTSLLSR
jgi:hypothetical protein